MFDCRFCAHLKVAENTQILMPFLSKIMDGLLTMATQSTDDVLALVLESLRIVMSVRKITQLLDYFNAWKTIQLCIQRKKCRKEKLVKIQA